ncbi:MAG: histidine phosphatase family protein [Hyphomicrobium sp.]|uniref:histidine phosphatase family protein n=1 Tax=Hyphomicrobium sp. TaxID=82 RepID=UPI0039E457C8
MPPRLTFIANASTPAVRAAAFPLDEGIDDVGRQDAAALASQFTNFSAVLSSPAKRAIETATALNLRPEIDPSLRDLDLGDWSGQSLKSVAASDPHGFESWLSDTNFAPHGGETVDQLFARASVWLEDISARDGRILAVTHPSFIRAAILAAIHAGPTSFWNIDVAPLAVVQLTSNGRRWALRSIAN